MLLAQVQEVQRRGGRAAKASSSGGAGRAMLLKRASVTLAKNAMLKKLDEIIPLGGLGKQEQIKPCGVYKRRRGSPRGLYDHLGVDSKTR